MTIENIDAMLTQYVATALWSSLDGSDESGGEPLDSNYGPDDVDSETLEKMRKDCAAFAQANEAQIEQWGGKDCAWEQAGHDFWLTRNGHGAGFWDRGAGEWPNDGAELTTASKAFGECDLYVADGQLHL